MAAVEKSSAVEFRLSGRELRGVAVPYGQVAKDRAEYFEAGAFVSGLDSAVLNLQHDSSVIVAEPPNLTLSDSPQALELRAELQAGAALSLIRRGTLTGLSVGFVSIEERQEGGRRAISRARLDHIALVDSPSYGGEIELRAAFDKAWLTAEVRYGKTMQCTCQGGGCDSVSFDPGAFDALGEGRIDLLAVGEQGFGSVLGSLRRGTLLTETTERGLRIGLTNPSTEAARQIVETARVADVLVRPVIDVDASEFSDEGTVRRFTKASVTAILVKASPNDKGHIPAQIEGVEERRRRDRWAAWL